MSNHKLLLTMGFFLGAYVVLASCSLIGTDTDTEKATLLYRVNAGAQEEMTVNGQTWHAEQVQNDSKSWEVSGGERITHENINVEGTDIAPVYRSSRSGLSSYSFSLPNGTYVVQLHFAETDTTVSSAGKRIFDVGIEGRTILRDFDPYSDAGGRNIATVKTVNNIRVSDGELNISFTGKTGAPTISGISIYEKQT